MFWPLVTNFPGVLMSEPWVIHWNTHDSALPTKHWNKHVSFAFQAPSFSQPMSCKRVSTVAYKRSLLMARRSFSLKPWIKWERSPAALGSQGNRLVQPFGDLTKFCRALQTSNDKRETKLWLESKKILLVSEKQQHRNVRVAHKIEVWLFLKSCIGGW